MIASRLGESTPRLLERVTKDGGGLYDRHGQHTLILEVHETNNTIVEQRLPRQSN